MILIFKFKFLISDALEADVKANKSMSLKVRVISDRRLLFGKFLKYSRTTSTSQMKIYFGFWGLWLNTPGIRSQILGWLSISIPCIRSWKADNTDLYNPIVLYWQPTPANSFTPSRFEILNWACTPGAGEFCWILLNQWMVIPCWIFQKILCFLEQ